MFCDICSSNESAYRSSVEGAELNVCESCKKFGKILSTIKKEEVKPKNKESLGSQIRDRRDYFKRFQRKNKGKKRKSWNDTKRICEKDK